MFKNMRIGSKLLAGFMLVATIAAFIGFMGYSSAQQLRLELEEIGSVRLPSVQALLIISEAQTAVDSAENVTPASSLGHAVTLTSSIFRSFPEIDNQGVPAV